MKRPLKKSGTMPEREILTEAYEVRVFRDKSEEPKVMKQPFPKSRMQSRVRQREL